MSDAARDHTWRFSPHKGATFIIALAVADIVNDTYDNELFTRLDTLVAKTRLSRKSVTDALSELERDGWLTKLESGRGRGGITRYRWNFIEDLQLVFDTKRKWAKSTHLISEPIPELNGQNSTENGQNSFNNGQSLPINDVYTNSLLTERTERTEEATTAIAVVEDDPAKIWWESLNTKPIGKNSWFALKAVCSAASSRGYTSDEIVKALRYIGTVPSLRQMDLVLRGVGVKTRTEDSFTKALAMAQEFKEAGK